ncbi:MAG: hypothetical protein HY069_00645 [Chlamydiia bacterium]|nr:hypothetical protein [Chlamydiia bacterium]
MIHTIAPQSVFHAKWDAHNRHLNLEPPTLWEKVGRVVWNILSVLIPVILVIRAIGWYVAYLSKKATLPSVHLSVEKLQKIRDLFNAYCDGPITDENRAFRQSYTVERHTVVTPDKVPLATLYFKHKKSTADTPTIIYYQPNMAISELAVHSWLFKEAIRTNTPINLVAFDYRDVYLSKNPQVTSEYFQRPEDLILDGEAIFQFVRDQLHVPAEQIRTYGWSLGGCISANVKALHQECTAPYVNERSFSSTADVIRSYLKDHPFLRCFLFWFPCAIEAMKWNLVTPIARVSGKPLIVYHPRDSTIKQAASCYELAVQTRRRGFDAIRLEGQNVLQLAEIMGFNMYHHATPLDQYRAEYGTGVPRSFSAVEEIAKYLFAPVQPAQIAINA